MFPLRNECDIVCNVRRRSYEYVYCIARLFGRVSSLSRLWTQYRKNGFNLYWINDAIGFELFVSRLMKFSVNVCVFYVNVDFPLPPQPSPTKNTKTKGQQQQQQQKNKAKQRTQSYNGNVYMGKYNHISISVSSLSHTLLCVTSVILKYSPKWMTVICSSTREMIVVTRALPFACVHRTQKKLFFQNWEYVWHHFVIGNWNLSKTMSFCLFAEIYWKRS